MRSSGFIVLGTVALAVAGGTGLLVTKYLDEAVPPPSSAPAPVVAPPPKPRTVGVLVAASTLEVGRTLDASALEWQEWPDEAVRRDQGFALAASEAERDEAAKGFDGSVLRSAMVRGEPFTEEKVIRPGGGSVLALVIAPGMRSYTVAVDAINGAGGMVQPGDRVDIMLTGDLQDPGAGSIDPFSGRVRPRVFTETILTAVKLISSDRRLNPATAPETPIAGNVTLEVTMEQAEKLATATRMGRLQLVVRPLRNGPEPERQSAVVTTDVGVVPALQAARRDVAVADLDRTENPFRLPPMPPAPKVPVLDTITVYRWTAPSTLAVRDGRIVAPGAALPYGVPPGGAGGVPDGSAAAPGAGAQPAVPGTPMGAPAGSDGAAAAPSGAASGPAQSQTRN